MRPNFPALFLASVLIPSAALASPPASADARPASIRISTGVVSPQVLNAGEFSVSSDALQFETAAMPAVQLALDLDEKGDPSNVKVVKSVNAKVDAQVLAAARGFRFRPALLDRQPVPVNLRLTVFIQR
jgi:TonB family protein